MAVMSQKEVKAGTRVRLRAPSPALELTGSTGTIVRPDEWLDYYVVRLDAPAIYHHADGHTEELVEIVEDIDNLDLLPSK